VMTGVSEAVGGGQEQSESQQSPESPKIQQAKSHRRW